MVFSLLLSKNSLVRSLVRLIHQSNLSHFASNCEPSKMANFKLYFRIQICVFLLTKNVHIKANCTFSKFALCSRYFLNHILCLKNVTVNINTNTFRFQIETSNSFNVNGNSYVRNQQKDRFIHSSIQILNRQINRICRFYRKNP